MIKKQFAVTVAVGAVMFFAGFGLRGESVILEGRRRRQRRAQPLERT